jgi:hypothetical protein
MIEVFRGFSQSLQQSKGQYLKVGHDFLRLRRFQFTKPPKIRRYMTGNTDRVIK